ncbi:MAG TPA: SOS response-associated peptidase [Aestuariivirgaceae bacterium]|nr:SOS response-associated peptidase [Aestuariivirgaceae bacterium]
MCGLYSFKRSAEEVRSLFGYAERAEFPPRDYVAPGGPIGIVRTIGGTRHFALVRWGFVPSWASDIKPGKPLINARAESVLEKPTFRNAMSRRRCLIPADGFYQWKGDVPGRKQAFYVHRPDHELFALAGLWELWTGADGSEIETAAVITTRPTSSLSEIHDRMPAIIMPEDFTRWLDTDSHSASDAAKLLVPPPDDYFSPEPVELRRPASPKPASRAAPESKPADQLKLL